VSTSYPNTNPNPVGGNAKPVQAMDQMAASAAKTNREMLSFESSLQRSLKVMQQLVSGWKTMNGSGNSSPLLNDSVNNDTSGVMQKLKTGVNNLQNKLMGVDPSLASQQMVNRLQSEINGQFPIPRSMGSRIAGGAAATAYGMLGMMPYTNDAVTQRLLTQSVGSMIGMDPNQITAMSNKLLAGGITGPYSAQAATAALASQGIIPTMGSFSNIMGQTGGLSVLTGMSNEQTAAAFGGINGMNFLRVGIQARDSKGNIRNPADIANDLYRRLYGGRKLTEAQAAQVFNQNSRGYQGIMAVAGGNADLAAQLQELMYYQGKGGGKKLDLDAQNVKDNILKLRKDDPSRAMFNYQGSQSKLLQNTANGLVGGYSAALDATATVNNGMAGLASILPQVTNAFGNLKGFLDTLPTAGNTGAALTGGLGGGIGGLSNLYMMRKMNRGLNALEKAMVGGGEAAAGTATLAAEEAAVVGGSTAAGFGARMTAGGRNVLSAFGKTSMGRLGLAGAAGAATYYGASKVQNRLQQYGRDHGITSGWSAFGNEAFNAGKYAATGAAIGSFVPGVGTVVGGAIGGTIGIAHGIYDFATGNWGRGGPGDGTSKNHNTPKNVKSDLPRNSKEAAAWAIEQATSGASGWHNYCEKFVESAWGKAGRYSSAIAHWNIALKEHRAHNGKDAPPGAFVFWGGGQYGHTAISIGGGKVVSTDILREGKADVVNIDTITKRWGKKYLGWADPSRSTVLDKNAKAIDPGSYSDKVPVSQKSSQHPTSTEQNTPWYQKALNSVTSSFSGHSTASSSSYSSGTSLSIASDAIGMSEASSASSLMGFGAPSPSGHNSGEININMTVNIGSTSQVDIQTLARQIRTAIDKEMRMESIRGF